MMGLVMLALLAAAPVHAERWTLWAHGTDHSGAEEWQRVQGSATEAECWASFAGLQLTGVDADVVHTVVEGHKTTAYYRDGTKYVVEFMCLLDTVNPPSEVTGTQVTRSEQ